jgi:hypothetical protein
MSRSVGTAVSRTASLPVGEPLAVVQPGAPTLVSIHLWSLPPIDQLAHFWGMRFQAAVHFHRAIVVPTDGILPDVLRWQVI